MSLSLVPRIIQSPKTITFLVIPFLVLRNIATWAYIKSTFSEESFTTSVFTSQCLGLSQPISWLPRLLLIHLDVASSIWLYCRGTLSRVILVILFVHARALLQKQTLYFSHFSKLVSQHDNFPVSMWLHWSQKAWESLV